MPFAHPQLERPYYLTTSSASFLYRLLCVRWQLFVAGFASVFRTMARTRLMLAPSLKCNENLQLRSRRIPALSDLNWGKHNRHGWIVSRFLSELMLMAESYGTCRHTCRILGGHTNLFRELES
jgi:hypothetical protein